MISNIQICFSHCGFVIVFTILCIAFQITAEAVLFRRDHRSKFCKLLFNKRLGRGILSQIMLLFIASGLVYISEVFYGIHHSLDGSAFYPYVRALFSMALPATMILGWEAGAPISLAGNIITTIFNFLFLLNGIARIGRAFLHDFMIFLSKGKKMIDKPHYLILGGELKALEIVLEQMTNSALGCRRLPITVVLPLGREDDIKYLEDHFDNTSFINYRLGSIFDDSELIKAGIIWAKSILIMPTKLAQHERDTTTLFVAKAIDKIFSNNQHEKPHIVAKIINPMFGDLLEDYVDEIICSEYRDFWIASAAVFNKGLNSVYNNLIHVSEDTNEIYITGLPEICVGLSYEEIVDLILSETRKISNSITVIGIKRKDEIHLNPPKDIGSEIFPGDRLIVISRKCPDQILEELSKRLSK